MGERASCIVVQNVYHCSAVCGNQVNSLILIKEGKKLVYEFTLAEMFVRVIVICTMYRQ